MTLVLFLMGTTLEDSHKDCYVNKGGRMPDRRAGRVPHVREDGGGKQPRSRNKDGRWRRKRSDAGRKRK